jgi:hypothetical protein
MLMVARTKPILSQTDEPLFVLQKKFLEAVLTAQMEEITAHLSASVLTDNISGPSFAPGPLSSRNGSDDYHASTTAAMEIKAQVFRSVLWSFRGSLLRRTKQGTLISRCTRNALPINPIYNL